MPFLMMGIALNVIKRDGQFLFLFIYLFLGYGGAVLGLFRVL